MIEDQIQRMKEIIYGDHLEEIDKVYLVQMLNRLLIDVNQRYMEYQAELKKLSKSLAYELNRNVDLEKDNKTLKFNLDFKGGK